MTETRIDSCALVGNVITDNTSQRELTEFTNKLEALMLRYDIDHVTVGWRRPTTSCPWCAKGRNHATAEHFRRESVSCDSELVAAIEKATKSQHEPISIPAKNTPETEPEK